MQIEKHPLGVMPKKILELRRMIELPDAINEYLKFFTDGCKNEVILEWVYELKNMLEDGKGK